MSDAVALAVFTGFVLVFLVLDGTIFHRRPRSTGFGEAALWSAAWLALAAAFNWGVFLWRGRQAGVEFLAAYFLEGALSLDNVFVFALIFGYAAVPREYQHRVLFWGVVGALVARAAFIALGVALLSRFHWVLYVFGAFLVWTGARLLRDRSRQIHPEKNFVLRWARRAFSVTEQFEGGAFWVRREGKNLATPLFLVLLMVESTDILFAVDSVPAVFAVSSDPFVLYSSNILAVLSMRALYFLLANALGRFRHLRAGLSLVLVFVGAKMLVAPLLEIPLLVSLLAICAILAAAVLASL